MKVNANQWRFCRAIACKELSKMECTAETCSHTDVKQALEERRAQLKAVKYGS